MISIHLKYSCLSLSRSLIIPLPTQFHIFIPCRGQYNNIKTPSGLTRYTKNNLLDYLLTHYHPKYPYWNTIWPYQIHKNNLLDYLLTHCHPKYPTTTIVKLFFTYNPGKSALSPRYPPKHSSYSLTNTPLTLYSHHHHHYLPLLLVI